MAEKDAPRTRRKVLIRFIQRAALTLALLDVALYFAAVRPLDNLAKGEWERLSSVRHHVQEMQANVTRLEKARAALPGTNDQLGSFVRNHVPPRRKGFSRADHLVQRLTQQSGLQLSSVEYRLDPAEGDPFERLGVSMNVVGSFNGLLKWAHALETASDFIVIRGFSFASAEGGASLELHVTADLYLSP